MQIFELLMWGTDMYRFGFLDNKLLDMENNTYVSSVIIGTMLYVDGGKNNFVNCNDVEKTEEILMTSYGNFVKIYKPLNKANSIAISTSAFFSIYYYINENFIFISNDMKEIEDMYADKDKIDTDSCFYYIASGNFPPMQFTFFKTIKKIEGEHTVIISKESIDDSKYTFKKTEMIKKKEYFERYSGMLDREGFLWNEYFEEEEIKPYVTISGVDSFNAMMALPNFKINAVHLNVNEIQKNYVTTFVSKCKNINYIELTPEDQMLKGSDTILTSYKNSIRPYLKYKTNETLEKYIAGCGKTAVVTGDLVGLSMATKSFNSTIEQHYFYGRHLLGLYRKLFYTEYYIKKVNKRNGKKNLFNFMVSLFVPFTSFDSVVPYKGLKYINGLTSEEHKYYLRIVQNMVNYFAHSVGWNVNSQHYNPGKLFRSYKREFYSPTLTISNHNLYYAHKIRSTLFFSSTVENCFLDNYSMPLQDLISSKKIVYRYFEKKMGTTIKKIGKEAIKKTPIKSRLLMSALMISSQIPDCIKNTRVWKIIKNKNIKYVLKRDCVGCIDLKSLILKGEIILLSDCTNEQVLKEYFKKIECSFEGVDMVDFSPVQERYLNLAIYINSRIKCEG